MTKTQHRKTAVALMFQNVFLEIPNVLIGTVLAETVTYEHYILAKIFNSQCNIPFL